MHTTHPLLPSFPRRLGTPQDRPGSWLLCGPGVRPQHLLVDRGAPAGPRRHLDVAVLDRRRHRHQLRLPRDVVDVDLHDPHVRQRPAELGRDDVLQDWYSVADGSSQGRMNRRTEDERRSDALDPRSDATDEARPAVRGALAGELQRLSRSSRALWESSDERRRLIGGLLDADSAGDALTVAIVLAEIDAAVREALSLLDLPRGPITELTPLRDVSYGGRKAPDCRLEIGLREIRRIAGFDRGSDTVLRTWVHESIHGRQPYASSHIVEFRSWRGYEEGLAEGLARIVARDLAGLDPVQLTYRYYVAAYETLCEASGVDHEGLLRALWRHPLGAVRQSFAATVDALRQGRSLPPLTQHQRGVLRTAADRQFGNDRIDHDPNRSTMLIVWRGVFR